MNKSQDDLVRALGLGALIIYGVGDILGAGIYALIGKIAGHSGSLTWLSFAIAMAIVFLTALSYSELGSRYPRSGGVSIYIQEAFGQAWLSTFVGVLLFTATIFSMSTLSQAFVGYLRSFGWHVSNWVGVLSFFIILLLINIRGIKQSSIANIISTTIEVSGLVIILVSGLYYLLNTHHDSLLIQSGEMPSISEILQGTALAFFAFTGFEDLANVAEEVKQPEKNLPRAILSSLAIAGFLYLTVSWMATTLVPGKELGVSEAPLFDVVSKSFPAMPLFLFSLIAIFAIANTSLLNYITASRLLYGMSHTNLLPKFLQAVHKQYHTPYLAILVIFPLVCGLGLMGTLKELASSTSAIVLTVFSFSNIALIKIKYDEKIKKANKKIFRIPKIVPWLAVILNMTAISFLPLRNIISAVTVIMIIFLLSLASNKYLKK